MKRIKYFLYFLLLLNATILTAFDVDFDLSVLPEDNGSGTNGKLTIQWDSDVRSCLNIIESKSQTVDSAPVGYGEASIMTTLNTSIQCDLIPYEREWNFNKLNGNISVGLSFLKLTEDQEAVLEDENGYLDSPPGQFITYSNTRKATLFSPRIGFNVGMPLLGSIQLRYSGFISPIYYLSLTQETGYSFMNVPSTNTLKRWSFPYFEHSISTQFGNWGRLAIYHSYQRIDFQTMDWNENGSKLTAYDDIQVSQTIRLGIEPLLSIPNSEVKIKAGCYWQYKLFTSNYWSIDNKDSSLVFAFGIEG